MKHVSAFYAEQGRRRADLYTLEWCIAIGKDTMDVARDQGVAEEYIEGIYILVTALEATRILLWNGSGQ